MLEVSQIRELTKLNTNNLSKNINKCRNSKLAQQCHLLKALTKMTFPILKAM